jgi:16S rRNA (cytosine967-C5)-methyltransferase
MGAGMSASAARHKAREAVTRVRERDAYAAETVETLIARSSLEERDRAFAARLALGTIATRGTLDEAIARYVDRRRSIEAVVADALAVSAYEILFMRTPSRAAVNEGVELVKALRPPAASLANAVLRRLSRDASEFPWGDPASDVAALARRYGHPEWIAQLWCDELGRERAAALMEANNEAAPLYVSLLPFRVSPDASHARLQDDGADLSPCGIEGCFEARCASRTVRSPVLSRSHAIVADAGAQLAVACVPLRSGATIVEMGAGRGTKSILLQARAANSDAEIRLIAVDVHAFKLDILQRTVEAVGSSPVVTIVADATAPAPRDALPDGGADAVLIDAPCSGLGTLRRHQDRRWRAKPAEIEAMAAMGERILIESSRLVKPGGFVVYSTCTIASRENDAVIDAFLAAPEGSGFVDDPLFDDVPDGLRRFLTERGRVQSIPEIGGPDGHFIARLRRTR